MALVDYNDIKTSDSIVNGCLTMILSARFGRDARAPMSNAVDRCYNIAIQKSGVTHGVTRAKMNEHLNRIENAVFGEEVRDALKTALTMCYTARGESMSSAESGYLTDLIQAQTAEDFKNAILKSISKCCRDVRT